MPVVSAINKNVLTQETSVASGISAALQARQHENQKFLLDRREREDFLKDLAKNNHIVKSREEIDLLLSAVENLAPQKQKELLANLSKQEGFLYTAGVFHSEEKGSEEFVKNYSIIHAQRLVLEKFLIKANPELLEDILKIRSDSFHQGLNLYANKVQENILAYQQKEKERLNKLWFHQRLAENVYQASLPVALDVAEILCLAAVSFTGVLSWTLNQVTLHQYKEQLSWNKVVQSGIEKVSNLFNQISPLGSLVTRTDGLSAESSWSMVSSCVWAGLTAGKAITSVAFSGIMAGVDTVRMELGMWKNKITYTQLLELQDKDESLKLQKDAFYLLATIGLSALSVRSMKAIGGTSNLATAGRIAKVFKNPWVQVLAPSVGMSGAASLGEELLNIGTEKGFSSRNLFSNTIYGTANSQVFMGSLQGIGYLYVKCRSGLTSSFVNRNIAGGNISQLESKALAKYFSFSQKFQIFRSTLDATDGLSDVWEVIVNDFSRVNLEKSELSFFVKSLRTLGFGLKFGSALYDTKDINEAVGDSGLANSKNLLEAKSVMLPPHSVENNPLPNEIGLLFPENVATKDVTREKQILLVKRFLTSTIEQRLNFEFSLFSKETSIRNDFVNSVSEVVYFLLKEKEFKRLKMFLFSLADNINTPLFFILLVNNCRVPILSKINQCLVSNEKVEEIISFLVSFFMTDDATKQKLLLFNFDESILENQTPANLSSLVDSPYYSKDYLFSNCMQLLQDAHNASLAFCYFVIHVAGVGSKHLTKADIQQANRVVEKVDNLSQSGKYFFAQALMEIPEIASIVNRNNLFDFSNVDSFSLNKFIRHFKESIIAYTFAVTITYSHLKPKNIFRIIRNHSDVEEGTLADLKEMDLGNLIKNIKQLYYQGNVVRVLELLTLFKEEKLKSIIVHLEGSFNNFEESLRVYDAVSAANILQAVVKQEPDLLPWLRLRLFRNSNYRNLIQTENLQNINEITDHIRNNPWIWIDAKFSSSSPSAINLQQVSINNVNGDIIHSNSEKILQVSSIKLLREMYVMARSKQIIHDKNNYISLEEAIKIARSESTTIIAFFDPFKKQIVVPFAQARNKVSRIQILIKAFSAVHELGHLEIQELREKGAQITNEEEEVYCWQKFLAKAKEHGVAFNIVQGVPSLVFVETELEVLLRNILISQEKIANNHSAENFDNFLINLKEKYKNNPSALAMIDAVIHKDPGICYKLRQYKAMLPSKEQLIKFVREAYNLEIRPIADIFPAKNYLENLKLMIDNNTLGLAQNSFRHLISEKNAEKEIIEFISMVLADATLEFQEDFFTEEFVNDVIQPELINLLKTQDLEVLGTILYFIPSATNKAGDNNSLSSLYSLLISKELLRYFSVGRDSFDRVVIEKLSGGSVEKIREGLMFAQRCYPEILYMLGVSDQMRAALFDSIMRLSRELELAYNAGDNKKAKIILEQFNAMIELFIWKIKQKDMELAAKVIFRNYKKSQNEIRYLQDLYPYISETPILKALLYTKEYQDTWISFYGSLSFEKRMQFPMAYFSSLTVDRKDFLDIFSIGFRDIAQRQLPIEYFINYLQSAMSQEASFFQEIVKSNASLILEYVKLRIVDPNELIEFSQFVYSIRYEKPFSEKLLYLFESLESSKFSLAQEMQKHWGNSVFVETMNSICLQHFLFAKAEDARYFLATHFYSDFSEMLMKMEPELRNFLLAAKGKVSQEKVEKQLNIISKRIREEIATNDEIYLQTLLIKWSEENISDEMLLSQLNARSFIGLTRELIADGLEDAVKILENIESEESEFRFIAGLAIKEIAKTCMPDLYNIIVENGLLKGAVHTEFSLREFCKYYDEHKDTFLFHLNIGQLPLLNKTKVDIEKEIEEGNELADMIQALKTRDFEAAIAFAQTIVVRECASQNIEAGYRFRFTAKVQKEATEAMLDAMNRGELASAAKIYIIFGLENELQSRSSELTDLVITFLSAKVVSGEWIKVVEFNRIIFDQKFVDSNLPLGFRNRRSESVRDNIVYNSFLQSQLADAQQSELEFSYFRIPLSIIQPKMLNTSKIALSLETLTNPKEKFVNFFIRVLKNYFLDTNSENIKAVADIFSEEKVYLNLFKPLANAKLEITEIINLVEVYAEIKSLNISGENIFVAQLDKEILRVINQYFVVQKIDDTNLQIGLQKLANLGRKLYKNNNPVAAKVVVGLMKLVLLQNSSRVISEVEKFQIEIDELEKIETIFAQFKEELSRYNYRNAIDVISQLAEFDSRYVPWINTLFYSHPSFAYILGLISINLKRTFVLNDIIEDMKVNPWKWIRAVKLDSRSFMKNNSFISFEDAHGKINFSFSGKKIQISSKRLLSKMYIQNRVRAIMKETNGAISLDDAFKMATSESSSVRAFYGQFGNRIALADAVVNGIDVLPSLNISIKKIFAEHELEHRKVEEERKRGIDISYQDEEFRCWRKAADTAAELGLSIVFNNYTVSIAENANAETERIRALDNLLINIVREQESLLTKSVPMDIRFKKALAIKKYLSNLFQEQGLNIVNCQKVKIVQDRIEEIIKIFEIGIDHLPANTILKEEYLKFLRVRQSNISDEQIRRFVLDNYDLTTRPIAVIIP